MAGMGGGLSARQFERLLRRLGCAHVRSTGGHMIWEAPSGGMVVSPVPGRKGEVPVRAVKNAARALGVSMRELVP